MGVKRDGVELRENSIRVHFSYCGNPCKETLKVDGKPLPPTPANHKYAIRVVREIRQKISHGVFQYAEYFPDSKTAKAAAQTGATDTLEALGKVFLESKGQLKPATQAQYATAVRFWLTLLGAETKLIAVDYKLLASKIGKYPWPSAKTHNNYLIVLRGMFAMEYRGPMALRDPTNGITNMRAVKKLPDPLSAEERDKILAHMAKKYDARVWAYFQWMFFTGMRPEEAIALRWSDIDFNNRTAHVQRVRTFKGSERDGSKTDVNRVVDLVPEAMQALAAMKHYTYLRPITDVGDIFQNPVTERPWHDERSQRDHYWRPTLKALGIRARRAYCTRHTFCTVALMRFVNPAYVATQAGHSVKMLLDTYFRWIPGNDNAAQRAAMEAAMATGKSSEISPAFPQAVA